MTEWNYRVVHRTLLDTEDDYAIHEIHYDADGTITQWSVAPVGPGGGTPTELVADIQRMLEATESAVLEYDELQGTPVMITR